MMINQGKEKHFKNKFYKTEVKLLEELKNVLIAKSLPPMRRHLLTESSGTVTKVAKPKAGFTKRKGGRGSLPLAICENKACGH